MLTRSAVRANETKPSQDDESSSEEEEEESNISQSLNSSLSLSQQGDLFFLLLKFILIDLDDIFCRMLRVSNADRAAY